MFAGSMGGGGVSYAYYQADSSWNPVVDPTRTTNYGHIPLATDFYVPVQNGIPLRPLFQPPQSFLEGLERSGIGNLLRLREGVIGVLRQPVDIIFRHQQQIRPAVTV